MRLVEGSYRSSRCFPMANVPSSRSMGTRRLTVLSYNQGHRAGEKPRERWRTRWCTIDKQWAGSGRATVCPPIMIPSRRLSSLGTAGAGPKRFIYCRAIILQISSVQWQRTESIGVVVGYQCYHY